jgi:hypothetical protein
MTPVEVNRHHLAFTLPMSSPPPDNILEDPITELEAALRAHAFGIDPRSHVLVDQSFPRTSAERATVTSEARSTQQTPGSVHARAKIVLLEKEGEAEVVLDQRGYTVSRSSPANGRLPPAGQRAKRTMMDWY